MKERPDDSSREILKIYKKYVIEDIRLFLIAPEWHQIPTYWIWEATTYRRFVKFPKQMIWIFGEWYRIFVVAYEILKCFGGLLNVNISDTRTRVNSFPGRKIAIHKIKHKTPLKYKPNYLEAYLGKANYVYFGDLNNSDYVKGLEYIHKAASINHGKKLSGILGNLGFVYT